MSVDVPEGWPAEYWGRAWRRHSRDPPDLEDFAGVYELEAALELSDGRTVEMDLATAVGAVTSFQYLVPDQVSADAFSSRG